MQFWEKFQSYLRKFVWIQRTDSIEFSEHFEEISLKLQGVLKENSKEISGRIPREIWGVFQRTDDRQNDWDMQNFLPSESNPWAATFQDLP